MAFALGHNFITAGKRLGRHLPSAAYRCAYHAFETALPAYLRRLRDSDDPILVGPWTSEIGHELVYWIPFLTKLRQEGIITPERAVVVSRGGNASWYGRIANRYYNVFEHVSPAEYRHALTELRKGKLEKRLVIDAFDRLVLQTAVAHFGFRRFHVLHPWVVNVLLTPVWKGGLPTELELRHLAFEPFPYEDVDLTDAGIVLDDDREYVAVKFHFNENFRPTRENVAFMSRLVDTLAQRYRVLLLQQAETPDNHAAPPLLGPRDNVIDCRTIPHADNLRFQTFLIRRAKYLATTLGGLAFLPGYLGRRSFAFYSGRYDRHHEEIAFRLFDELSPDGLHFLDATTFDLQALP